MVGEEDELEEEDELLMQAVQEQAQREMAKYQRPANYPPPVVNLAGPVPPTRAAPKAPPPRTPPPVNPPKRAPPKPPPPPIEDEEDSEVELLSISSEEEDNVPPRKTAAAGAVDSKHDDLDDDSDLGWDDDDEEPEAWKFVDEAEVRKSLVSMHCCRNVVVQDGGMASAIFVGACFRCVMCVNRKQERLRSET